MSEHAKVAPWLCRWGWHRWAPWGPTEKGMIRFPHSKNNGWEACDVQDRTCLGCGKNELRRVG